MTGGGSYSCWWLLLTGGCQKKNHFLIIVALLNWGIELQVRFSTEHFQVLYEARLPPYSAPRGLPCSSGLFGADVRVRVLVPVQYDQLFLGSCSFFVNSGIHPG